MVSHLAEDSQTFSLSTLPVERGLSTQPHAPLDHVYASAPSWPEPCTHDSFSTAKQVGQLFGEPRAAELSRYERGSNSDCAGLFIFPSQHPDRILSAPSRNAFAMHTFLYSATDIPHAAPSRRLSVSP